MCPQEAASNQDLGRSLRASCGQGRVGGVTREEWTFVQTLALETKKVWLQGAFHTRFTGATCWGPARTLTEDKTAPPSRPHTHILPNNAIPQHNIGPQELKCNHGGSKEDGVGGTYNCYHYWKFLMIFVTMIFVLCTLSITCSTGPGM